MKNLDHRFFEWTWFSTWTPWTTLDVWGKISARQRQGADATYWWWGRACCRLLPNLTFRSLRRSWHQWQKQTWRYSTAGPLTCSTLNYLQMRPSLSFVLQLRLDLLMPGHAEHVVKSMRCQKKPTILISILNYKTFTSSWIAFSVIWLCQIYLGRYDWVPNGWRITRSFRRRRRLDSWISCQHQSLHRYMCRQWNFEGLSLPNALTDGNKFPTSGNLMQLVFKHLTLCPYLLRDGIMICFCFLCVLL